MSCIILYLKLNSILSQTSFIYTRIIHRIRKSVSMCGLDSKHFNNTCTFSYTRTFVLWLGIADALYFFHCKDFFLNLSIFLLGAEQSKTICVSPNFLTVNLVLKNDLANILFRVSNVKNDSIRKNSKNFNIAFTTDFQNVFN